MSEPEITDDSAATSPRVAADVDGDGEVSIVERVGFLRKLWRRSPRGFRLTVVSLAGSTLIVLGLLLVVLPGPFTLPLVLAGLAVLATEFAWAARALERGRAAASGLLDLFRRR